MKYVIDKKEKYTLVRLDEEKLDASVAPELKSELITMHAEGAQNMILDMSSVKYTDSSGLSALLVGNRVFREDGGMFIMAGLNDHVVKLIKISQLDSVLTISPTPEEAIDTVFLNQIENDLNNEASESENGKD
uniref:Anti-sigma factor antagonist n=1 Tax=Roseihalotalea indica TaxID=2867963 RepID=A0AA49GRH0_9BACT|nr:STAS domain-containing protein [Tunicatimonas sp. TK19036]